MGNVNNTLSILICSLESRRDLLKRLLDNLFSQMTDQVQILINVDNGEKETGQKRNELLESAKGKYIAFIDDDDNVSNDYISLILESVSNDCDVVGMHLLMTVNNNPDSECRTYHSIKYASWYDKPDPDRKGKKVYFRCPNHLNPVKRELALQVKFPNITIQEDSDYSHRLYPLLKTESYIEKPIYYYYAGTV